MMGQDGLLSSGWHKHTNHVVGSEFPNWKLSVRDIRMAKEVSCTSPRSLFSTCKVADVTRLNSTAWLWRGSSLSGVYEKRDSNYLSKLATL